MDDPVRFLLKSEPADYSVLDLQRDKTTEWDGVRNYQARNVLRSMRKGDRCWFYHSRCATPAIVGTCRVARTAAPDRTALDPKHANYDPKSDPKNPKWDSVLLEFESVLDRPLSLAEIKLRAKTNETIAGMKLLKQRRLSVMPIERPEYDELTRVTTYLHVGPSGDVWTGDELFAAKHLQPDYVKSIPLFVNEYAVEHLVQELENDAKSVQRIYDANVIPLSILQKYFKS